MKGKEERIFQTDGLCRNKACESRLKQKFIKYTITKNGKLIHTSKSLIFGNTIKMGKVSKFAKKRKKEKILRSKNMIEGEGEEKKEERKNYI